MSRLKDLRKYVYKELYKMEDKDERTAAITHLNGVALAATMLAKKRGFDPEVAAMAGVLHDLHACEPLITKVTSFQEKYISV